MTNNNECSYCTNYDRSVLSCPKGDQFCVDCGIVRTCWKGRIQIALELYPQESMESLRYIDRCFKCEQEAANSGLQRRVLRRTIRTYALDPFLFKSPVTIQEDEEEDEVTEIQLLPPIPLPPFPLPPRLSCYTPQTSPDIYRERTLRSGKEF